MGSPERADGKPMSSDQLIELVRSTRKKVSDAATDLEKLSQELRRRLGMTADGGGEA